MCHGSQSQEIMGHPFSSRSVLRFVALSRSCHLIGHMLGFMLFFKSHFLANSLNSLLLSIFSYTNSSGYFTKVQNINCLKHKQSLIKTL